MCLGATATPGYGSPTWFNALTKIFSTGGWVSFGCRRCFFTGASILAPNPTRWNACARHFLKLRCDSCTTVNIARTAKRMHSRNAMRLRENSCEVPSDSINSKPFEASEIEAVAEDHFGD